MKKIVFLMLAVCCMTANAQKKSSITQKDIQLASGSWKGNLVFTDYKDDSTQIDLKVNLDISLLGSDTLFLKSDYTDTEGKLVNDSSYLIINNAASEITYGGELYYILRIRRTGSELMIITSMDGLDNNKDAEIHQTFIFSERRFIITKEVRYLDNPIKFFTRHKLVVLK